MMGMKKVYPPFYISSISVSIIYGVDGWKEEIY
jgi:hypothetical protein